MIFTPLQLEGAYVIQPERRTDERGFFARVFCVEEFAAYHLPTEIKQANISYNRYSGTLRGMHYQVAPHAEAKLVSCTRGAIYDVIIDLRPDSATYKQWVSVDLTADNRHLLFIPEGFAHGFQTLADDSEVSYQMFAPFHAESARGVRWDDTSFGIEWREDAGRYMSERDRHFPDFQG